MMDEAVLTFTGIGLLFVFVAFLIILYAEKISKREADRELEDMIKL